MDGLVSDKRERILGAAARLIVANGLQCSMAAIAEEAGVATGSLYNYFTSKEALVLGVYTRVAEEMTAALVEPDSDSPPADRLTGYIERYIDFLAEDAQRARLFDYLDNTPYISVADAFHIFGPLVKHGVGMIEAAQQAGVVRDGPAAVLMSFVRGAIRNTLKRWRMSGMELAPGDRQMIADMCWSALR